MPQLAQRPPPRPAGLVPLASVVALGAWVVVAAASGGQQPPAPRPIGVGFAYHPLPGDAAAAGRAIGLHHCTGSARFRYGVHLEVFANRLVVLVPAGIGVATPLRRSGPYVLSGRCSYALRTREPTGVFEVSLGRIPTLGEAFAIWGQPLSRTRLAGFRGTVSAFVSGRRIAGDPRSIRLGRHAQVVLEVGGYVRPHVRYLFARGL